MDAAGGRARILGVHRLVSHLREHSSELSRDVLRQPASLVAHGLGCHVIGSDPDHPKRLLPQLLLTPVSSPYLARQERERGKHHREEQQLRPPNLPNTVKTAAAETLTSASTRSARESRINLG
jgi:hypothetical protein